eukprot:2934210-Pyramimonas_sp.AAC.1
MPAFSRLRFAPTSRASCGSARSTTTDVARASRPVWGSNSQRTEIGLAILLALHVGRSVPKDPYTNFRLPLHAPDVDEAGLGRAVACPGREEARTPRLARHVHGKEGFTRSRAQSDRENHSPGSPDPVRLDPFEFEKSRLPS